MSIGGLNEEETKFYKDLFAIYDNENQGYIDVDRFIEVTKQNMPDNWKNDQQNIDELVKVLDPFNLGQINFDQFVMGIKKLTNDDSNQTGGGSGNNMDQGVLDDPKMVKGDKQPPSNMIDSSISLLDVDFEATKSNSSQVSSNETFYEYDSGDHQLAPKKQNMSSTHSFTSNGAKSNADEQIFELGGEESSENETDKNSSSTFDLASFDRKELNDYEVPTGELISLDDYSAGNVVHDNNNNTMMSKNENTNGKYINDEDTFGLDNEEINNHRKSLSINSFSSLNDFRANGNSQHPKLMNRNNLISSKRRVSELYQNSLNHSRRVDPTNHQQQHDSLNEYSLIDASDTNEPGLYKSMHFDSHEHDKLIETHEKKIIELSNQNENLFNENQQYINRIGKLNNENALLLEKIRELEEVNLEIEKKSNVKLNEERVVFQDQLNKLNLKLSEERDLHAVQIQNMENQIKLCKEESHKYLKEITEIKKKIELTDVKLSEETDNYNKLKSDYYKMIKEKEALVKEREVEKMQELQKSDMLAKEIEDLRMRYQIMQKQRSNTVYISDETAHANQIRELEADLKQLRHENEQLNNQVEELKAQSFRHNLDNGRMLLHLSANNGPSLAAEMDIMSKDELMDKLKNEQQMTQRLREYIDSIISKIMLNNPELLEVCTNTSSSSSSNKASANSATKSSGVPKKASPRMSFKASNNTLKKI